MCVLEAAQSNLAPKVSALNLPYQNTGHQGFSSRNLPITGVQKNTTSTPASLFNPISPHKWHPL